MKENLKLTVKILELLGEGFLLSFERSKDNRRKMHQNCDRIWYTVDRKQLYRVLDRLKLKGIIKIIKDKDGIENIKCVNPMYARSLEYQFKDLKIKAPKRWDGKWRIVIFDIPETKRKARDAIRRKLKQLGFVEFQKSVFVYPHKCEDEINFVINFFNVAENVYILESSIKPDDKLRKQFKI